MSESQPMAAALQALAQNARFLERCSRLAGVGAWEWQPDSDALLLSNSACELPILGRTEPKSGGF